MTEFHQLQGRFNLAPIDARSGEKKFPFERNDDPVSLATRYKMMNDKVLERQNKESRKLKKKLNNFRTTKAEIYRVLADDGMIEPVFARPEVTEKSIYDATVGRRPQAPKKLNEREEKEFDSLKERFNRNKNIIQKLQARLHDLAGGKENLKSRNRDEAHDPDVHNGWSVLSLGSKVQVFCAVGKSLGHTKKNFVRSGKIVYFDAVDHEEAIRLCTKYGGNNNILDSFKEIKKQTKLLENLHAKGEALEGKTNKASERRNIDFKIEKESKDYRKMEQKCYISNYTEKKHKRLNDNTYGVLYEDNELEFGVARSRITEITSKSMQMSLAAIEKRKADEAKLCAFKPPHKSKELKKVPLKDPITGEERRDEDGNVIEVVAPSNLAKSMEEREMKRQKRLYDSRKQIHEKKMAIKKKEEDMKQQRAAAKARRRAKERKAKEDKFQKSQEEHAKRREDNRQNLEKLGIDPNLSKEERADKRKKIEDEKLKKKQQKVKIIRRKAEKRMEDEERRKEAEHQKRFEKEKALRDEEKKKKEDMRKRSKRHARKGEEEAKMRANVKEDLDEKIRIQREKLKEEAIEKYHEELHANIIAAVEHLANCKGKLDGLMKDIKTANAEVEANFDKNEKKEDLGMDKKDLIGRKKAVKAINKKINKLKPLKKKLKIAIEKFEQVNQFFFFAHDMRNIVEEYQPNGRVAQISKLLLDLWGRLDKKWDKAETKKLMKIFQVTESEQIPTKRQYWAPHGQYQLEKDKLKLYETSEQTLKDCEARLQDKDGIYNVTKAEEELANQWKPPRLRKRDQFLEQAFNLLDVNGDKEIDKEEFISGKANLQIEKLFKQSVCLQSLIDSSGARSETFDKMDTSEDDLVTWDELKSFVEKNNQNAADAITKIVFEELDLDNNGIIELEKAIKQITTSNKELKIECKNNIVGKHLLTPSVRKSAIVGLKDEKDENLLDDEGQISKKGFLKLLEIALQHADNDYIVYRKDDDGERQIYSIANNIKDWEKMKKIVTMKNKEREDAAFHKERTPETEINLSDEQREKFKEELEIKEKKNLEIAKKKARKKEREKAKEEKKRKQEKEKQDKLKKRLKNGASKFDVRKSLLNKTLK